MEKEEPEQLELPKTRDPKAEMKASCERYAARLSGSKGWVHIELAGGAVALLLERKRRKPK